MEKRRWDDPVLIFDEFDRGKQFKSGLGQRGLFEQNKINERFFLGDQWRGAQTGEKPLLRHNVIRRIGSYKMAIVGGSGVAVNYSAEGVPNTQSIRDRVREQRNALRDGDPAQVAGFDVGTLPTAERINLVMSAMCDYFKVTAERVKLDDIKNIALKKSYITGTGIVYTYWDERVRTGLYADEGHTSPITGDIRCEVLDVENVYFGDPNLDDVQEQPYIILAQRKSVEELKRIARRNRRPAEVIERIKSDRDISHLAGDRAENEPEDAKKATMLTKLYKKWSEDGESYTIQAVQVARGTIIRKAWDTKLTMYPIAKLSWENRANCVYGESEITYIISNQIAINRCLTAQAEALVANGLPTLLVDGDLVTGPITNDPGQILRVYGAGNGVADAIRYVCPPSFAPQFDNTINNLITQTLTQAGANDAALGDLDLENASAIVANQQAAERPLQLLCNRFYSFIEDIARIWADFWINLYGKRLLKIEDDEGEWYMPFTGEQYRDLIISARVDVGAAGQWSELQTQQTLDNMLQAGLISPLQYLERIPKNTVPNLGEIIREYKEKLAMQQEAAGATPNAVGSNAQGGVDLAAAQALLPPEYREKFAAMSDEQKMQVAQRMMENGR